MTLEIAIVMFIIAITLYLFISERFGVDTISIMVMLTLMITGILTPQKGFSGFTNPATITVICMFVISAAIYKSGALSGVTSILKGVGKKNSLLTLLVLMLVSIFFIHEIGNLKRIVNHYSPARISIHENGWIQFMYYHKYSIHLHQWQWFVRLRSHFLRLKEMKLIWQLHGAVPGVWWDCVVRIPFLLPWDLPGLPV